MKSKILNSLRIFKSKINIKLTFVVSFILFTITPTTISFAEDTMDLYTNLPTETASDEIYSILLKFYKYLTFNGVIEDVLQFFKFKILNAFYYIANSSYNMFRSIFDLNTYFNYEKINKTYSLVLPITIGILVLSLIYLGYRMLLQKKDDRIGYVFNIVLAGCLILIFPIALTTLNTISKLGAEMVDSFNTNGISKKELEKFKEKLPKEEMLKVETNLNPVDNIYKTLFIDMQKINDEDFKKDVNLENPNDLTVDELQRIDPKKLIEKEKPALNYVINGKRAYKINWHIIGHPGYYSWTILFWQGVVFFLIITYVYVLCSIKQVVIIFNLAVLKILSPLIFSSDLNSSERTRATIKEVLNSYLMLLGMHLLVTIFSIYMNWVTTLTVNFFTKTIMLIGGAVATVGAGIYERILGISGVGSRFSPLQTMYQLKMLTNGAFRKIGHNPITRGVKSGIVNVYKPAFSKDSPYFNKENINSNNESNDSKVKDNLKTNSGSEANSNKKTKSSENINTSKREEKNDNLTRNENLQRKDNLEK